ncbi:MAG: aromatic amino acid transport family protein [bacterium]|nr:aromatic amino acid transport family protein [bacterium]
MKYKYKSLRGENIPPRHLGIFRKNISLFEGVALIVSGTIGAGVLGLPFVIAKVGVLLGTIYIVAIGVLMMGLNLLLGKVATVTKKEMQLVGLAQKYLGNTGKWFMTLLVYLMLWGVLTVYIIGEGEVLSALFGGSELFWSIIFFAFATILIYIGMRTIKVVELFLSLGVLGVVLILVLSSAYHIQPMNLVEVNFLNLLLPYGILLFAFHGTTSVPEAYSILINKEKTFKRAIIIAGVISIVVYALFAAVIVGVTGAETSEIATIALGEKLGIKIFLLGNLFAVLAMGTSCLMAGLALRDSMKWDFNLSRGVSTLLVSGIPFLIFIFGIRGFIEAIDIVGGVFMSVEMLLILLIYWKAKQQGDLKVGKYKLHHTTLLLILLLLALTFGAVYSVVKLF